MTEIFCPFKYSEKRIYCDCPYPKGELNWKGPFRSLEQERILHMIELDNARESLHDE